jgi:deoxyribonuclease-4
MNPKIGFHVSIAGAISNSVDNASKIGCRAFQIFTRNPRGWIAKPLLENDIKEFQTKLARNKIQRDSVIVHMPYLPNFAAPDGHMYEKSVDLFREEIERCSSLGVAYLVIHLGSHLGKGQKNGTKQLVKACNHILDHNKSSDNKKNSVPVMVLLENGSGQKNTIGSSFEEIRSILDELNSKVFGVCLDTCHAFASGYDLRNKAAVVKMLDHFDKIIGLKELKLIHMNDSKTDLHSKIDRHEHIGLGKIGKEGFVSLLHDKRILNLPIIMETPIDNKRSDLDNLTVVLNFINQ